MDDGSTPPVSTVLDPQIRNHPRFLLVEQTQRGAGAARNQGFRCATGEYVVFLDGDDFLFASQLRKPLERAIRQGLDLLSFGTRPLQGEPPVDRETFFRAENYYRRAPKLSVPLTTGEQLIHEMWARNSYLPNSAFFATRTEMLSLERIVFRENSQFVDNDFTFKVFCAARTAVFDPRLIPHRKVLHKSSISSTIRPAAMSAYLRSAADEIASYSTRRWENSAVPLFAAAIEGQLRARARLAAPAHQEVFV